MGGPESKDLAQSLCLNMAQVAECDGPVADATCGGMGGAQGRHLPPVFGDFIADTGLSFRRIEQVLGCPGSGLRTLTGVWGYLGTVGFRLCSPCRNSSSRVVL